MIRSGRRRNDAEIGARRRLASLSLGLLAASCGGGPDVQPVPDSPPRSAAPSAPDTAVVEERWFADVDGTFAKEERLDLAGDALGALVFRYGPISDSGVELERALNGNVVWRVHVEPLGIAHSKYRHEVKLRIEGERIVVDSVGARRIVEVRDLATGRQISREVTNVQR